MAVVNVDATQTVSAVQNVIIARNLFTTGANKGSRKADAAVAASDSDGSVYRLFKDLPPTLRIVDLLIGCTAITAGTAFTIGFYEVSAGAVIDADILATALDLSSALALTFASALDGCKSVLAANMGLTIGELLSFTSANSRNVDLCATGTTVGSAAGTISARMDYVLPSS